MKVATIGIGYVGLATSVGLVVKGSEVVMYDIDQIKIDHVLRGTTPFYEPAIENTLKSLNGQIKATPNLDEALKDADVVFVCVQTTYYEDGSMNFSYIEKAAEALGKAIAGSANYPVIVIKSTVTPGATEEIILPILEKASGGRAGVDFGMAMNPEFLSEGKALEDFLEPYRIVIGEYDKRSGDIVSELYRDFDAPVLRVDVKTAEMIKCASNAFLATKISYINELGNICKLLGINTHDVARGMGLDPRISPHFLQTGIGFGGSCLPKDTSALSSRARELGYQAKLLESVLEVNRAQPLQLLKLAEKAVGELGGKRIAILGLAFKANTEDMREAPSIKIINELLERGATIFAYDPMANNSARTVFGDSITYCSSAREALDAAGLAFILTEWDEFKDPCLYDGKPVFAGRLISGFDTSTCSGYEGICW